MRFYEIFAPILAAIFAITIEDSYATDDPVSNPASYFYIITYSLTVVCGLISYYLAYKSLNRPGISNCVRKLVLKRHGSGILIYVICNFYLFLGATISIKKQIPL
jgi:hypothetical protein